MPSSQLAPMLSWLPEHASADAIEGALRALIASSRTGLSMGMAIAAVPVPQGQRDACIPSHIREARLLRLSLRQYEVLVLLSRGLSVKDISRQLRVSVPTVKSHTLHIYRRLSANNKTEAVFVARGMGAALAAVSGDRDFPCVPVTSGALRTRPFERK